MALRIMARTVLPRHASIPHRLTCRAEQLATLRW